MSMPIDKIIPEVPSSKFQVPNRDEQILTDSGFYWRERNGVKVLVCSALEEHGFANGFSTRLGGVSPFPANDLNLAGIGEDSDDNILENRRRFLNVFEGEYKLATAWQVHGNCVKIVKTLADAARSDDKSDALISNLEKVLVGVKTADCVPVLLGDRKTKATAAVHAGWRGTAQSIVRKSVEKMIETFDTDPKNLICAIGPAAGCESYEIGQDVIDVFTNNFSAGGKYFTETREGHALVDLPLANKDQLMHAGVSEKNIFTAPFCTMKRIDLFFSYRIEKRLYGKIGRLMSVIGRKLINGGTGQLAD